MCENVDLFPINILYKLFSTEKKTMKFLILSGFFKFCTKFSTTCGKLFLQVDNLFSRICVYIKNGCEKRVASYAFFAENPVLIPYLQRSALKFLDKGFHLMLEGCIHFHIVFNNVDG